MVKKMWLIETQGGITDETKNKKVFANPLDLGAYGRRVTEGDYDGHSICLKDADTSDSRSVSGFKEYCFSS